MIAGGAAALVVSLSWSAQAMAANTIYWTTPYSANKIYYANLDGSSRGAPATVNTGTATVSAPWGIGLDPAAGKIYWANYGGSKISWANLDGSGAGDLPTGAATVSGALGVAVDTVAGKIYWANYSGNKISWANLNGSGGGNLNTGTATVSSPAGVALDVVSGKIYWANYNSNANKISFARLDNGGGGDLNIIGTTVNQPWGLTISSALGKVFWGNFQTNALDFANLDGTGGGILSTTGAPPSGPMAGAIDPTTGKIYWSNWGNGTINSANLDGSGGGALLYTSPAIATAMPVLFKAPAGTGAPTVSSAGLVSPTTLTCSRGSWGGDLIGEHLFRAPRSFAYGWTRDGVPIPGATSDSLAADVPGNYGCNVTATNGAGSTTQASELVGVVAPVVPAFVPPPPPPPPPPYPRISITTSGGWTVSNRGVRIVSMRIRGVPVGSTVKLTCKSCRVSQTMSAKKSTITLAKLGNKLLKRGQSFSVLVTKPGSIGDQITLTVKRYGRKDKDLVKAAGKPFTVKHACVPVGAKKAAKTCPARPSA